MKKEINYLSLPDHFNKFLLMNFNQKINYKNTISLKFKLQNILHLGSALKAIYLLEIIFPRKVFVLKIFIKKKKLFFGQKSKDVVFFSFIINLSNREFIEFFRFFCKNPIDLKKYKAGNFFFINRKLKQFDFNNDLIMDFKFSGASFLFSNIYYLN